MITEEELVRTCKIHDDEPVFEHWTKYYCGRCKRWYDQ